MTPQYFTDIAAVAPPVHRQLSTSVLIFIMLTAIFSRQQKKAIGRVLSEALYQGTDDNKKNSSKLSRAEDA